MREKIFFLRLKNYKCMCNNGTIIMSDLFFVFKSLGHCNYIDNCVYFPHVERERENSCPHLVINFIKCHVIVFIINNKQFYGIKRCTYRGVYFK